MGILAFSGFVQLPEFLSSDPQILYLVVIGGDWRGFLIMAMNGGNDQLAANPVSFARSGDGESDLAGGDIMQTEYVDRYDIPCGTIANEMHVCKDLHKAGALTDSPVPADIVEEEAKTQELAFKHRRVERTKCFPSELIGFHDNKSETLYHCYLLEFKSDCQYDVNLQDIVLTVCTKLPSDFENLNFNIARGNLVVHIKYVGYLTLNSMLVSQCQRFQLAMFKVLLDHDRNKLRQEMD